MCGIAGIFGKNWNAGQLEAMTRVQRHRGPDAEGIFINERRNAGFGHTRLSIIGLSDAGRQPMTDESGQISIVFNGEIYNYRELKRELSDYRFKTDTDTEVLLAAFLKWGASCLDKLIGMFVFGIWNEREQTFFAARDRFGVKPLYYHPRNDGTLFVASEIKALHVGGVKPEFDEKSWATYFTNGLQDYSPDTFWQGVKQLAPGHFLRWSNNRLTLSKWYELAEKISADFDSRSPETVEEEYFEMMKESVRLRFRSDVPVGINLSGGVDSSALLALSDDIKGKDSDINVYTFVTGDANYDELPWVEKMLSQTNHPLTICRLEAKDVPRLAECVQAFEDEPFGGFPTLCYAKIFEQARADGVIVLLDGNGMDEQWAGYDYYLPQNNRYNTQIVQGTSEKPVRPNCLTPEFRALAEPLAEEPFIFPDQLRNQQYRDTRFSKIPRVLRFNDRVSMRSSTELREPFLDHRLVELAIAQPPERKIAGGIGKFMLREIIRKKVPGNLCDAPKRPVQTPQREWLRGELRSWAKEQIEKALDKYDGSWLDGAAVRADWNKFCRGESDNSYYVWQWISLSMVSDLKLRRGENFESICNPG